MARDARIALLLELLDQSFRGRAWHGTPLRGALRGVSPAAALRRPAPGRLCAWDYVLHCAFWMHEVRRRVSPEAIEAFPRSPANFPAPGRPTAAAWRADIRLLEREFALLRKLVERMPAAALRRRPKGARWTSEEQLLGVAAHNFYHTGQLQLVRRLTA